MSMQRVWGSLFLAGTLLVGCGGNQSRAVDLNGVPLTVEAWKAIPGESKYEPGTIDRLRLQDQSLEDDRKWSKFISSVVKPEMKKDGKLK